LIYQVSNNPPQGITLKISVISADIGFSYSVKFLIPGEDQLLELDGYHIDEKIHESSHSLTYRAHRESDNKKVIIKVLTDEYPSQAAIVGYMREFEFLTMLKEAPGVINPIELKTHGNSPVLIFEDFMGTSLKRLVEAQTFSLEKCIFIALEVARCLEDIHAAQIVHKDINPANIIYNLETNQIKVIDFGISTALLKENPIAVNANAFEGTPAYVSPEQDLMRCFKALRNVS
jgi:serine/threonine protein kinase